MRIARAVEQAAAAVAVVRVLLDEALRAARAVPADAIRVDAYDAAAGGGGFYRRCGYAPRGGKSYRGVPLLCFELMTGAHL